MWPLPGDAAITKEDLITYSSLSFSIHAPTQRDGGSNKMVTRSPPHAGEPAGLVTGWPTYVPGLAGPCPFPYLPLIFLFGARLLLAGNGLQGKEVFGDLGGFDSSRCFG